MTLDADTVLWALRGLHDPKDGGVRADDVALFMSKDATLSEDYSSDDVTVVLESLVAEGALTHASTTGADEFAEAESSHTTTLYRFASDPDSGLLTVDRTISGSAARDEWDDWLGLGADQLHDVLPEALAENATVGVEVETATAADEADADAYLRARVDELERERDALVAERDTWRRHAELTEQELSRSRAEGDVLRTRVRELENLLERERALASERSETARRAAAGLARALQELELLQPSAPDSRARPRATRHHKALRGNWLQQ